MGLYFGVTDASPIVEKLKVNDPVFIYLYKIILFYFWGVSLIGGFDERIKYDF